MAFCMLAGAGGARAERAFDFKRDTFSFDNETALEYHDGQASPRPRRPGEQPKRFTQHCFVMSRTVMQFRKFVRFDPKGAPLGDKELAERIRKITRVPPWSPPLPEQERIVMPGYADLRSLSRARAEIVQKNIGLGWPTYFRPGNWRILLPHGPTQQGKTHEEMERSLGREGFFVAYLTNFPRSLNINHGVLVYAHRAGGGKRREAKLRGQVRSQVQLGNEGRYRYAVYDPNHHDAPRTLEWSERERSFLYQHDTDFVGGPVIVWQVYGYPLQ